VKEKARFPGRLGLQQRILPSYRVAFLDRLASSCAGGLSVFAGEPALDEARGETGGLLVAQHIPATNRHLLRGRAYLCYQEGLLRWLEAWDPAALVVEANWRYLSTPGAVDWMHRRGRPVLGWGLGAPAWTGGLALAGRALYGRFLRRFDGMIAYSTHGAAQYAQAGFPSHRIFVAANAALAVPSKAIRRQPASGRALRVLFAGRLVARKRVDALIRACAAIDPTLRLRIVGDGPERLALEAQARNLAPHAEFTGELHGEALAESFRWADLFVLPGTGGLAVQEAMAHGLPVIVAQGDGTQSDLVSEENGWLIPAENEAALQAALRTALAVPSRLTKMGAASFRRVSECFNIDRMAESFFAALAECPRERRA
jgi:glycosyltransferase involved in cell wall biosynthesis